MSLCHIAKLDMDSMVVSLLLKVMRRKSWAKLAPSSKESALVSEESNDKVRYANNNGKEKEKFKLKGEIKCYCVIRWVT